MATKDIVLFRRESTSLKDMFKTFTEQLVTLGGALVLCSLINVAVFLYYLLFQ